MVMHIILSVISKTAHGNFSYTYDNLDRLRTASLPDNRAREGMLYDKLGNLEVLNRRNRVV
ncbi:hypothetical protein [Olivibacter ginsenosidimutans]|uniref:hypothetical protein n=1 Tax=Olivibacter ginsenosidimutans TaxID=1176537 RepID=UPI0031EB969E